MSRSSSEQSPIRRQWLLADLLVRSRRAWSLKELAERLGVSKSTVSRDLDALGEVLAVLEEPAGTQKRVYRIAGGPGPVAAFGALGPRHVRALEVALAALAVLDGTPVYADLVAVRDAARALGGASAAAADVVSMTRCLEGERHGPRRAPARETASRTAAKVSEEGRVARRK